MEDMFSRTGLLLGRDALDRLSVSRVAVFGVGGVGGYVCEVLARCGVGAIDLIDGDVVEESNLNRQVVALRSTLGRSKCDVMAERIRDINPDAVVRVRNEFFMPGNADSFDLSAYSYVADAVDNVTAKLELASRCYFSGVREISCMGAGNKLDPSAFRVADIYSTRVCPLARVMRRELKKRGVERLKVVYSEEEPAEPREPGDMRRVGSVPFVPSVAGMTMAGEIVKDLIMDA